MSLKSFFNIFASKLISERLNESIGGVFGFFSQKTKREVKTLCLYKSAVVICFSDSLIITYDTINEQRKLEISEHQHYNIQEMEVLYSEGNFIKEDFLICMCEKNIIMMDFDNFKVKYNIDLKQTPVNYKIDYNNSSVKLVLMYKTAIIIYEFVENMSIYLFLNPRAYEVG